MDNGVLKTDGDQQKSGVGILMLRFGCLTAGTAVSSISGNLYLSGPQGDP